MAKATDTQHMKRCVNCMFWGGARTPNFSRKQIQFDTDTRGVCMGKSKGKTTNPGYICSGWQKWGVLT